MFLVDPSFELRDCDWLQVLRSIEDAGRLCKKSKSSSDIEETKNFCRRMLVSGHESVIEHGVMSVRFIVDRGISHEIVRHRLASFSQESTRYCNYGGGVSFVIPPWVKVKPGRYDDIDDQKLLASDMEKTSVWWMEAMKYAEDMYCKLLDRGDWSPQQARSVLPNSLKTEIVVTANIREWRHIFRLRCSKAAHPQMREIMWPLFKTARYRIPVLFDDLGPFD